eukprot:scaffold23868_cov109-Isochrysis_galbana.AAC.2
MKEWADSAAASRMRPGGQHAVTARSSLRVPEHPPAAMQRLARATAAGVGPASKPSSASTPTRVEPPPPQLSHNSPIHQECSREEDIKRHIYDKIPDPSCNDSSGVTVNDAARALVRPAGSGGRERLSVCASLLPSANLQPTVAYLCADDSFAGIA